MSTAVSLVTWRQTPSLTPSNGRVLAYFAARTVRAPMWAFAHRKFFSPSPASLGFLILVVPAYPSTEEPDAAHYQTLYLRARSPHHLEHLVVAYLLLDPRRPVGRYHYRRVLDAGLVGQHYLRDTSHPDDVPPQPAEHLDFSSGFEPRALDAYVDQACAEPDTKPLPRLQ